jgi:hypothetical protein
MLNIISEISEIERKMKDLSDEETVKNVEKMKEFLPVGHHSVHPTAISLPSPLSASYRLLSLEHQRLLCGYEVIWWRQDLLLPCSVTLLLIIEPW